jgi:hypothetical protein
MIWRGLLAIFAGIVVSIVLTLGSDALLRLVGVLPPAGQKAGSGPLLFAVVYRCVYGVIGAYITARLAPYKPMGHVLVGGTMGLAANALGAIATWNQDLGPHWYPIALTILALPAAWLGGKLWLSRNVQTSR